MTAKLADRIAGSLYLAGMGDALGAPTEQWTIDEIVHKHGGLVTGFGTPPPDTFAGANGGLRAEITDDASQMYYLARALVAAGGSLQTEGWVACLLDWAQHCRKASFMGPSTLGIVRALQAAEDVSRVGVIGQSTRKMTTIGNTNGAAMRAAPCGLIHAGDVRSACEQTLLTCLPSHDTDVAIAAACAVAAGCARAVVTDSLAEVIEACIEGARMGQQLGRERARTVAGPSVPERLKLALNIAAQARDDMAFLRTLEAQVGNSVLAAESVPAAIGVLLYAQADPLRTIALCSTAGNDTDSIATMAGALAGALRGHQALPAAMLEEFLLVNGTEYGLPELVDQFTAIAAARCGHPP
jgi:ADP-ribosylglycohydrolase